jgi:hypothetical protein
MKKFTESLKPKPTLNETTILSKILNEHLSIMVNEDLTSENVEIYGIEDVEYAINEHVNSLKKQWIIDTITNISLQLESGKPLKTILENLYESSVY